MADEPQGYVIGIREIYEELRGLKDGLNAYMAGQDLKVQELNHRVAELEKDKSDAKALRRLVWTSIATSLLLPILVGVVVTLMTK